MKWSVCFFLLGLLGCQSAQEKAEVQLRERLVDFSKLESHVEKRCLVQVDLSAPTRAKYQKSYPERSEDISKSKNFLWDVRGSRCEIKPVSEEETEWLGNHSKILKGAFCVLLQGFQIQSPLVGVEWMEKKKKFSEGVWTWEHPSKGLADMKIQLTPLQLKVLSEQGVGFYGNYHPDAKDFPKLTEVARESSHSGLKVSGIQFQDFTQGRVTSVFPREIQKMKLFILDERFSEFQFYASAEVLRCESF